MILLKFVGLLAIVYLVEVGADIPTYYLDRELCNQKINMSIYNNVDLHSFRLKLSEQHYYPHNLNCQLQIQVQKDSENIMFYFQYFDVRPPVSFQQCSYDWLELHDGNSTESQFVCGIDMKLCGISPARTQGVYFTRSNYLTIYFKSDEEEKYTGFDMIITRFRYGQCRSDEYACANGRCIDESLECSGYDSCGDGSGCKNLHLGYIISIVTGAAILVSLAVNVTLGIMLCKARKFRSRTILPEEKTPLTTGSSLYVLHGNSINTQVASARKLPAKQPSESSDHTQQTPFLSLLHTSGSIFEHSDRSQSPQNEQTPIEYHPEYEKKTKHITEKKASNEPKVHSGHQRPCLQNHGSKKTYGAAGISNEQTLTGSTRTEKNRCFIKNDIENTQQKQVCSCESLRGEISEIQSTFSHRIRRDSGYTTTRHSAPISCENTEPKRPGGGENTEVKRVFTDENQSRIHSSSGVAMRYSNGTDDNDKVNSNETSLN